MARYALNYRRHFIEEQFATVLIDAKDLEEALAKAAGQPQRAHMVWIQMNPETVQTKPCLHTVWKEGKAVATLGNPGSTLNGACLADGWIG